MTELPNIANDSSRHSPPARALPWAKARLSWLPGFITTPFFGKPLAPTREEWDRVEQALWQGDAPMDKVVDWMFAFGPRQGKALFDQALMKGIDSVTEAPVELSEFFALIDGAPAWLQRERLDRGAKASDKAGKVGFFVLRDLALMGGYTYFNSMNQTLAASGALQKETGLRLGETGKWLFDVTEVGGLTRFSPGFITTIRVRMVHALVRRHLKNKPDWDFEKWGLPINQMDMLATYLAFGPVTLTGSRLFGVPFRKGEAADIMHMWRYIGWLMGVDEPWLAQTESDGLRKLFHTFMTHRLPDEKIGILGSALRDEPLSRNLPGLDQHPWRARLMRWFLYQQHISNSSLILGPVQRRRLGIPLLALPWYPLLSAPLRFIKLSWLRWRGEEVLEAWATQHRKDQSAFLQSYFGDKQQDIIQPDKQHPAHLG